MLPASIGSHTQERAAFQEAGHAVMVRMLGGEIEEIEINLDLRTNVWEGGMAPVTAPVGENEIRTAFAGPLAEAKLVANLYQPQPQVIWTIEKAASLPVLTMILPQSGPFAITFSANGQKKTVLLGKEMFSGDWKRADDSARLHSITPVQFQTFLDETIDYVNRADVWDAIIQVALDLLKKTPNSLVWKIEQSANGTNKVNGMIDRIVKSK